jgi:hypothetical protein
VAARHAVPTRAARFALLLLPFVLACRAATSDLMTPVPVPRAIQVRPDAATVVFIRPSSYAFLLPIPIVDGRGRFLGVSLAESHFAVFVTPGQNIFLTYSHHIAAVRANLAPGKTYYVVVAPTAAGLTLLAMTPSSELWGERRRWLGDTTQHAVDEARGQRLLLTDRIRLGEAIGNAHEALRAYSTEEMAARMLDPNDGI